MTQHFDHVIVGGGMAADAAARAIREQAPEATVAVVGEETTAPFYRPALSKDLWVDPDASETANALDTAGTGATLLLGTTVTGLDRATKTLTTSEGDITYGSLLLATGGHPRELPQLPSSDRVVYYRTLRDYQRLRALVGEGTRVAVVGGGFIGTEIAAALAQNGASVTLLFLEPAVGAASYPDEIVRQVEKKFLDAGVTLRAGTSVSGGRAEGDGVQLDLDDGSTLEADVVVVGLGIVPASDLARESGLDVDERGGVVVDGHLRTLDPDVYAAGDVASYSDPLLGRRRVEHADNAESMGALAGRVMAGADETYAHTPYFWSDLFDLGYEAVGRLDSNLETVVVDKGEGNAVVYYLDGGSVVGVLLWGVWDSTDKAREVIATKGRPEAFDDLI